MISKDNLNYRFLKTIRQSCANWGYLNVPDWMKMTLPEYKNTIDSMGDYVIHTKEFDTFFEKELNYTDDELDLNSVFEEMQTKVFKILTFHKKLDDINGDFQE